MKRFKSLTSAFLALVMLALVPFSALALANDRDMGTTAITCYTDSRYNIPYPELPANAGTYFSNEYRIDDSSKAYANMFEYGENNKYRYLIFTGLEGVTVKFRTAAQAKDSGGQFVRYVYKYEVTLVKGSALTVTYDYNDGITQATEQNTTFGALYELPASPTRTGYTFKGWYCEGKAITAADNIEIESNHTLRAEWTPRKYTVNFNAAGGTVTPKSTTVDFNGNYGTLPTPSRAGYDFDGWFDTSDEKTESTDIHTVASDITLTAHWTPRQYKVSFDKCGGEGDALPVNVTFDSMYGQLPELTCIGKTFEGWYTSRKDGKKIESSTKVSTASDHTLYAHWSNIRYTLTFVAENANGFPETRDIEYGDAYRQLPVPYKTNYVFVNWLDNGTVVKNGDIYNVADNKTLIAQWTPVNLSVAAPSVTTIDYKNAIVLHASIAENLPGNCTIKWAKGNTNFQIEDKGDGRAVVTAAETGETEFTAVVYSNGHEIASASVKLSARCGLWQRIVAFFRSIFSKFDVFDNY